MTNVGLEMFAQQRVTKDVVTNELRSQGYMPQTNFEGDLVDVLTGEYIASPAVDGLFFIKEILEFLGFSP